MITVPNFFNHGILQDDDHDSICSDLKFFAKLVYVVTGSCSFDKEEILDVCHQISQIAGYLSLICWLFAQLPQIIKNHMRRSVDGVSLGFLLCWAAGDFLNLSSCLLTGAMTFQIILAAYYCVIDFIIGFQYYYYSTYALKHPHARLKRSQALHTVKSPNSALRHQIMRINNSRFPEVDTDENGIPNIPVAHIAIPKAYKSPHFNDASPDEPSCSSASAAPLFAGSRRRPMSFSQAISSSFITAFSKVQGAPIDDGDSHIKSSPFAFDWTLVGKTLAWSCTSLYLCSRIPQLATNYKNKTTKGVSILLFMAALSGNFLYSLSLITSREALEGGETTKYFWQHQLSYFIGASVTVIFDLMMLYQWYVWDYTKLRRTPRVRSGRFQRSTVSVPNQQMSAYKSTFSDHMSLDDSIEGQRSPIVMLSPKHARKLSELQPLSPQDFLIDSYLGKSASEESTDGRTIKFASRVAKSPSL